MRILLAAVCIAVASTASSQDSTVSPDDAFDRAITAMTKAFYGHVPEAATMISLDESVVPGTSVRFMDRSVAGNRERNRAFESALRLLKDIDPESLDPAERRTHAIVTGLFDGALEPSRVSDYGTTAGDWSFWYQPYAIVQNSGPTIEIPRTLISVQPLGSTNDAEAYLARLDTAAESLDGALEAFRVAVANGAGPPDFIIERSLDVVQAFIEPGAVGNPVFIAFKEGVEAADISNGNAYVDRALKMIDADVIPAYQRIADYLIEISATAPHDAGIWRLPNGEALYAATIRHYTDTDMPADDIHKLGLAEVDRITREMHEILKLEGYSSGTVGERMQQLNVDPRFLYSNDAAGKARLLNDIRADIERMYAALPNWFLSVPDIELEVRPVPEFSQDSAAGAYYMDPADDGSRPGVYFINLRDITELPSWSMPTLNFHEGVPGHHLDGATGASRPGTLLESFLYSNASAEGWALYAEKLAAEMGMYAADPYGNLGRLQSELFRAARLVVDTGIHDRRWSRERAIDYMIDIAGLEEGTAISEVERYAAAPAQALGYKLGELVILELRREAMDSLGDKFDIREFNQQVLDVAPMPLPSIQASVRNWIATSGPEAGPDPGTAVPGN